jgi:hypothetical protein
LIIDINNAFKNKNVMTNDFLSTNCKYSVIVARMVWKVNGIIDGMEKKNEALTRISHQFRWRQLQSFW